MALKGDRDIFRGTIAYSCLAIATKGLVACHSTGGSGVALGASAGNVDVFAASSGKVPVGVLLQEVVSLDQTRYDLNQHKEQAPSGAPVWLATHAELTTNDILAGQTPTAGQTAYLTSNGQITPTVSATGGIAATPKVGQFLSSKDADGYAKVLFQIPVV